MFNAILPAITVAMMGFQPVEVPDRAAFEASTRSGIIGTRPSLERSIDRGDERTAGRAHEAVLLTENPPTAGPGCHATPASGFVPDEMPAVPLSPKMD